MDDEIASLTVVELHDTECGISDLGATSLAEILKVNTALATLNLRS